MNIQALKARKSNVRGSRSPNINILVTTKDPKVIQNQFRTPEQFMNDMSKNYPHMKIFNEASNSNMVRISDI